MLTPIEIENFRWEKSWFDIWCRIYEKKTSVVILCRFQLSRSITFYIIYAASKNMCSMERVDACIYDEHYDFAARRTDSGFIIVSLRIVRGVASAKFHYRSPAINIINWAARAHRSSLLFFLSLFLFFFQPSVPSYREHPPREGSSSEYILVCLPVSWASSPVSFLNPPR